MSYSPQRFTYFIYWVLKYVWKLIARHFLFSLLTIQVLQALKVIGVQLASLEIEDTQGHLEKRGGQVL